jgi:GNAT superfamily N-acetyltransferase
MFQNIKQLITEPEVGKIISYAAFDSSPEGIANVERKYLSSDKLHFYGWVEDKKVIGICGFEVHCNKVEIHLISVAEDRQKQGIGGAMVAALYKKYGFPLEAETDDDAVEFYRKRNFITTVFQHPMKGKRHTCVLEERQGEHTN